MRGGLGYDAAGSGFRQANGGAGPASGEGAHGRERSRADLLVAFVEDGDLPMARVLFRELFGFADARFRQAAWAVVEALMARASARGSTGLD
jgi:hypothetical protein